MSPTKEKRRKKFHFPIFYIFLLLLVAAFVTVMHFALAQLEIVMADFENAQPKYAAEEAFNTYFASPDFAALAAACDIPENVSPLETKESFVAELTERYGGLPTSYAATTSGADGSLRYLVKAGDLKIAIFSLKKSTETTEFGFEQYEIGDIELYIRPEETVSVTARTGDAVYINGNLLDESYVTETGVPTSSCEHVPEGVSGITFTTYEAGALLRAPTVEVISPNGSAAPLTLNEETGVWEADIVYDTALHDKYADQMIKVAQNYAAYVMRDGYFASFSSYFDKTTDLYETIRQVPVGFVWIHNGYSFDDVSASEFYAYDENTFSCRIRFVQVLHRNGNEDYREQFDVTFYLHRVNGEFLIYDMTNNL